jgi:hypothetical protein
MVELDYLTVLQVRLFSTQVEEVEEEEQQLVPLVQEGTVEEVMGHLVTLVLQVVLVQLIQEVEVEEVKRMETEV